MSSIRDNLLEKFGVGTSQADVKAGAETSTGNTARNKLLQKLGLTAKEEEVEEEVEVERKEIISGPPLDLAPIDTKPAGTTPEIIEPVEREPARVRDIPGRIGEAAREIGGKIGELAGRAIGGFTGFTLGGVFNKELSPEKRLKNAIEEGRKGALRTGELGEEIGATGLSIFPNSIQTAVDVSEAGANIALGEEDPFIDLAAEKFRAQVPGVTQDQARNYLITGNYDGDVNKIDNKEVAKAWYASMLPIGEELWLASGLATSAIKNYSINNPTKGWKPKQVVNLDLEKGISQSIKKGEVTVKDIPAKPGEGAIQVIEAKPTFWRKMSQPAKVKDKGLQVIQADGTLAVGQKGRNLIVFNRGRIKETPSSLLEESFSKDLFPGAEIPRPAARPAAAPSIRVTEALTSSKIDQGLISRLQTFTPDEQVAFGRKVVDNLNKSLGTEITDAEGKVIPGGAIIKNTKSADGRPAQINTDGNVEIFVPDLMSDLSALAQGKNILAHEGADTVLFKMEPGESFDSLSTRYIQEVILHEKGHQKTLTVEDIAKSNQLAQRVAQARQGKSQKAILDAQTKLDKHLELLEQKANAFVNANRGELIKETFPEIKVPAKPKPTRVEKKILKVPAEKKVTVKKPEAEILKEKLRAEERAAKKGFKAGEEVAKTKFEKVAEKIKSRKLSLEAKRKELTKFATEFLPIRGRGKRLRGIANLKIDSPKVFQEQLDLIRKEAQLAERRTAIQAIQKELKSTKVATKAKFPSAKFEQQAQRDLNRIRANVKKDYGNAQNKIADLIADFQEKNPDAPFPDDLLKEIQLLKMEGLKDMTTKELRSVLTEIKSIKETGRTALEVARFNRNTEVERDKIAIQDVITGGKPLPSATESLKNSKPESRSLFTSAQDFLTTKQFGLEDVLDSLSFFDKESAQFESFLSTYVQSRSTKAFNLQNDGEVFQIGKMHNAMMNIYKLKKDRELARLMENLTTPVDLGFIKHADGKARKLTISRDQAIKKWMELQDETLQASFEVGLNWNAAVIKRMESILTPEDKKFGEWQLDFYREYYETINEVFLREYGVDLPFSENYSPISRDVETVIPENVLLAKESSNYATAKNSSLKGRVKNVLELRPVGSIETLLRHLAKMEHYKSWTDSMYNFRRIFGDKETRQSIIDFHGKNYLKVMDNFLNDFARDGVNREKIVTAVDKLRGNVTAALLGLNIPVALKQQIGLFNYGIELPFRDFTLGIGDFWRAPIQKAKFLFDNSSVLRERFGEGFERDIKFAIKRNQGQKLAQTRNFREFLFILSRNSDKMTVYQGAWASYRSKFNELTRKGTLTSEQIREQSIKYAEDVTNRVQETARLETLSEIQRGGSLAKLFTMFASQTNKYYRIILNSLRNIRAGRGKKSNHIKRIIWAWLIVPGIYNQVAEQFKAEEYRDTQGELAFKTALGPLGFPLITGQMWMSALGWITGEPFDYQVSAVFAFLDDIKKGIENFRQGDAEEATTYMIDAAGKSKGVPTTLFTKPIRKGLKETKKDEKIMSVSF